MEVSPSLVGGRLVVGVVVGVLVGSRRRCRTSKGEDALRTLGEDAEVVGVAVAPFWWCSSRDLSFAHEAWTWREVVLVGTCAFALVEHLHVDGVVVVLELVVDAVRRRRAHVAWR